MKSRHIISMLGSIALVAGGAVAGTISPSSVTTDLAVRPVFAGGPLGDIAKTIDGDLTSGFVSEAPTGMITYSFASPLDITGFFLHNNAGSLLTDGESIGKMDVTVLNHGGGTLFSQANVVVPEGTGGDPFSYGFPSALTGVASIKLNIFANNGGTGALDGIALREFSVLAAVPEPSPTLLLSFAGIGCIGWRRRR